ncbi:GNAT family N-acetyltransferase [Brevibacterium senegalense]|uniref:GNAT family N-acetyltransferase n=1 Tax=Brevibacterium senegalense TaxID=1033736 RepID=UPI0002E4B637|nr:GNAT family N-acetyltransferase [Brevibacterium senegalense]
MGPQQSDFSPGRRPARTTARLTLDVPRVEDAPAVLAIAGDPRTTVHNPSDRVEDLPEAQRLVEQWLRHWHDHGFGYWCVRLHGGTAIVGYCGVKRMTAAGLPVLNLLYRYRPEVWGRGYATEAARTVVAWVAALQQGSTILARVRPDNVASQRVALRAGLRRDPALDEPGEDGMDLAFTDREAVAAVRTT